MKRNTVIHGDCIEEMQSLPENSVDSVVTDPPYGLAFMGKSWDDFEPREFQQFSEEWGEEVLRVLKPGGWLLAFCGTRTYHRMVVGLEDAGFEIRDQVAWMYGSGFPKGKDISKAIDKHKGEKREKVADSPYSRSEVAEKRTEGKTQSGRTTHPPITEPSSNQAKRWSGWNTALKPAHEPVVVAQKPRRGTYAENVLEWGVGGLNIDACRIDTDENTDRPSGTDENSNAYGKLDYNRGEVSGNHSGGRWPGNVVLDPAAATQLDQQSGEWTSSPGGTTKMGGIFGNSSDVNSDAIYTDSGGASRFFYCAKATKSERNAGLHDLPDRDDFGETTNKTRNRDMYSMSHYCKECGNRKDSCSCDNPEYEIREQKGRSEKTKNDIATLKPINLMRWLVRLVTPEEGVVLDPFAGSGTTGCAATIENRDYLLIEKRERFATEIAPRRIEYWNKPENWDELKDHEELPNTTEKRNSTLENFTTLEKY